MMTHISLSLSLRSVVVILFAVAPAIFGQAQTERLDNQKVIEMARSGLSSEVIIRKIGASKSSFDISASSLIELKSSGVDDAVIAAMIDLADERPPSEKWSDSDAPGPALAEGTDRPPQSIAHTIAFGKSSLHPSRQALEKELLRRPDFQRLNLTILRYKEKADLFVDIGYVSGSWISHRYVYRIYDRRSGVVIAAGETTSWGSLAENLARHIAKSLSSVR